MQTIKHMILWFYYHIEVPVIILWATVAGLFYYHIRENGIIHAKSMQDMLFYPDALAYGFIVAVMVIIILFFRYVDRVRQLTNTINQLKKGNQP